MSAGLAGEVRLFACALPAGWLECDGGPLAVTQYPALFQALGTTYGGDGVNTFYLPDLRGGSVVGAGGSYAPGASGGAATVVLDLDEMPSHTHQAACARTATQAGPAAGVWAVTSGGESQYSATATVVMAPDALQTAGDWQGHPNMQPYLALTYAVATGT
jgi:microcystin-dependent protein